jgi:ElaB/YqjD/DUF883 family membrane-anchored ribosome-binding protein
MEFVMNRRHSGEEGSSTQESLENLGEEAKRTASQVGSTVASAANYGKQRAQEMGEAGYEMAADKVRMADEAVKSYAKEQPYMVIGIAAAAGLLLGMYLTRRH